MAKPLLQLAAVGILGVAVWKLLTVFMLPLLGLLLKVVLIAGVAFFLLWLFRKGSDDKRRDRDTGPPPPPPPPPPPST